MLIVQMKIKPLSDRVVVVRIEEKEKTTGGHILMHLRAVAEIK